MAIHHLNQEAISRSARMLRTALGPAIALWLEDPDVVEVMLNPDGRLWIDRLASGLVDTGERLLPSDGERIVRLVAHHVGAEVHAGSPRVSAELPETGERFEGLLPPVVTAPAFGEGRRRHHGRRQTLKALASLRELGGYARRPGVHLGADVVRDEPDDAFAIAG